jgi:hypothetical protein
MRWWRIEMRTALVLVVMITGANGSLLHGQEQGSNALPVTVPSSQFSLQGQQSLRTIVVSGERTSYWGEGGGIGAGILGLLGGLTGAGLCSESENTDDSCFGPVLGIGLLGALVGFTAGSLIGARFPKH